MPCTTCYNRSCPEPVSVSISQTSLSLDDKSIVISLYTERITGSLLTLPYAALPPTLYPVKVFVNGILQQRGPHYELNADDARRIEFLSQLSNDDVQVEYAYRVVES